MRIATTRIATTLCLLALASLLTACGFQLRGSYALPFSTLALSLAPTSELYAQIKRTVEASSPTRVVSEAKDAEATLVVLSDVNDKTLLSLSAAGRALEYQLTRKFSFRLAGPDKSEYIAPTVITIRRNITFNDDLVLSKETEETLLWRDMQNDLVQQLMRRLAVATLKPAEAKD